VDYRAQQPVCDGGDGVTKFVKNYRITITTDNGLVLSEESEYPSFFSAMHSTVEKSGIVLGDLKEGQSASVGVNVNVECLLNRPKPRRPRRAPEVIAQEKQARLAAAQKRAKEAAEYAQQRKAQADLRLKHVREQITHQIDHAFASGARTGTAPVAKFITCTHCAAPAAFLHLNLPIPTGAAVLDESTIVDAVCADHNYLSYRSTMAEVIPCAQLEFFYDGIRQIAIKTQRAA